MSPGRLNDGFEYQETIGAGSAGLTVLDHLVRRHRHSSADDWHGRLLAGRVLLDGWPAAASARLRKGQVLVWRRPSWREPDVPTAWAVAHRDGAVLGVIKPAGLPTLPGGGFLENSLLLSVRRRFPLAAPVHRLDRGASGIVLFALTRPARARLSEAFRRGEVDKEYRALVSGEPQRDQFEIEQPIAALPHPLWGLVHAAAPPEAPGSRTARSAVRVLRRGGGRSLLAVRPVTGRPHQIRIHLAAAGHPLLGETFYGEGGRPLPGGGRPGDTGYFLHAARIAVRHPETDQRLELHCLPPPALR